MNVTLSRTINGDTPCIVVEQMRFSTWSEVEKFIAALRCAAEIAWPTPAPLKNEEEKKP